MIDETPFKIGTRFETTDIFRAMREGILVIGQNRLVVEANRAARLAFSTPGSVDLVSKRLTEVIRDFELHNAVEKAISEGESAELRIEIVSESFRAYDVLVSPVNLGHEMGAIAVFYDVSHVERLEKVRQEFLSNISHELRTPLTSILAFVETLEDGAIDDQDNNRHFIEIIKKNAERMQYLIDDISELSSIEGGAIIVQPQHLKVANIVDDVIASLSSSAADREVTLINTIESAETVYADGVRLHQMLSNLVDNAIKFNRHGGTVTISHARQESDLIKVKDTGEGISRAHCERIFERFYRIDKARARTVGGTGLGLSIVKHLALLHGGEVTVKSIPNEGTTFCISLPVDAKSA